MWIAGEGVVVTAVAGGAVAGMSAVGGAGMTAVVAATGGLITGAPVGTAANEGNGSVEGKGGSMRDRLWKTRTEHARTREAKEGQLKDHGPGRTKRQKAGKGKA